MRHRIRSLGNVPEVTSVEAGPYTIGVKPDDQSRKNIEALATLFGGLFSATSLVFFAMGKDGPGRVLGVAGALTGAVLGAIRIWSSD
jgi:hypothetical protein